MSLAEFIKNNRFELDRAIARRLACRVKDLRHRNDVERQLWIENDEGLYMWAKAEGVRL